MYRVTSRASQPVVQTPQRAVSGLILYSQLIAAPDRAEAIAELFQDSVGIANEQSALVKLWAEMVYEEVRQDIRPICPSRLESVYTCVDMLEAFAFAYRTGRGGQICRGRTARVPRGAS